MKLLKLFFDDGRNSPKTVTGPSHAAAGAYHWPQRADGKDGTDKRALI